MRRAALYLHVIPKYAQLAAPGTEYRPSEQGRHTSELTDLVKLLNVPAGPAKRGRRSVRTHRQKDQTVFRDKQKHSHSVHTAEPLSA